jgi:segregation and condensation protein B
MASEEARAIEAILMVAEEPVAPHLLAQLLEVPPGRIEDLCRDLADAYRTDDRGFDLVRVAGGYRFQSHADLAPYVERFVLESQSARMSAAALETLAIVAYKQPVSRAQVASIRGVNADGVIRTLQTRGFVEEVGRDPGPGQAVLYGTTTLLLERLGLDTISQLPPLAQFVPGPEIMDALERSLRADRDDGVGADLEGSDDDQGPHDDDQGPHDDDDTHGEAFDLRAADGVDLRAAAGPAERDRNRHPADADPYGAGEAQNPERTDGSDVNPFL